jgi:hypothetical protein
MVAGKKRENRRKPSGGAFIVQVPEQEQEVADVT